MVPQTRSEEMPVRSSSHVKTTPSPQMVVRNVTKETASESLLARFVSVSEKLEAEKGGYETYRRAGTGTPRPFTQPNMRGA